MGVKSARDWKCEVPGAKQAALGLTELSSVDQYGGTERMPYLT
jgi:hypothetical protein